MNAKAFKWSVQLWGSTIKGACHAGAAWLGLSAAGSMGVDVPVMNWKALCVIIVSSGLLSMLRFLEKSPLPGYQTDTQTFTKSDDPPAK